MRPLTLRNWRLPALLLLLAVIPVASAIAHFVLMGQSLIGGAPAAPDEAQYIARPLPILLHLVPMIVFCVLGPFQLTSAMRLRWPQIHRAMGRVFVGAGLITGLSGLFMNASFVSEEGGVGRDLAVLVFGILFLIALVRGVFAAMARDIPRHKAWMIRAYAIGMGATTQRLLIIPFFMFAGDVSDLIIALGMWAGWVINLAVAEWIIGRDTLQKQMPFKEVAI